jgi:ubiquinol-cytochrome c reductase cytochrome b subunit
LFWVFVVDCFILGWIGANPPEGMYLIIGRLATLYYFVHFIGILPLLSRFEPRPLLPDSISEPVRA